jgi:pyruvate dehydrogenase E2 component (dihydrolipoamide acetyltransferase)
MPSALFNDVPVARQRKLSGVQKIVAERMTTGQRTTASVSTMAEVNGEPLLRELERLRGQGMEVALTHQIISITARCLADYPLLNSAISDGVIYEFAEINIALALATPNDDLQIAVIRGANEKSLSEIATETKRLKQRASEGKLGLKDVRGGTFTVSNYGRLQHTIWATPIITPGQSGVLGVGRVRPQIVADESSSQGYCIQRVIPLSLTYDHRIVNGLPAGRFLEDWAATSAQQWRS